jgi:hypothetical protein
MKLIDNTSKSPCQNTHRARRPGNRAPPRLARIGIKIQEALAAYRTVVGAHGDGRVGNRLDPGTEERVGDENRRDVLLERGEVLELRVGEVDSCVEE